MKTQYTALLLSLVCIGDVFASGGSKINGLKDKVIDKYAHIDKPIKNLTLDKFEENLEKDFHDQDPMFSILGFTNIDAIDLTEGFASGIYDHDVRNQYNQCILGFP